LLREHGAPVEEINPTEFSHGRTRNRAAEAALGEFLVFLSQDVEPQGPHFLARLIAAFSDERVAGAYSRILPHEDDDPLAARTVLDLPEASSEPWVRDLDDVEGVWCLDDETRARYLRFNNVASAIRTSVFRSIPFPEVAFAEDFAWAARVLTAGHRIAYVPESVAYHAHAYSMGKAMERYQIDALFHFSAHGVRVRPTLTSVLRGICYEVVRDARFLASRPGTRGKGSLLRSPGLRTAQILGQYLGSRGVRPQGVHEDEACLLHL